MFRLRENRMSQNTAEMFDENQEKKVSGGTYQQLKSGYCPFTPERVCRVDPVGGYYEENVKCQKCYWRE